jgi:antitoxin component of MazEF toxin-antitoxin module
MYNTEQQPKLRRVQAIHGESTFVLVVPKDFIAELNIAKGDYVKCRISNNQLIIEKAEI